MIVMRNKVVVEKTKVDLPGVIEMFDDILKNVDMLIVEDQKLEIKYYVQFRMKTKYGHGADPNHIPDDFFACYEVCEQESDSHFPTLLFEVPKSMGRDTNLENVCILLDDHVNGRSDMTIEEIANFAVL